MTTTTPESTLSVALYLGDGRVLSVPLSPAQAARLTPATTIQIATVIHTPLQPEVASP